MPFETFARKVEDQDHTGRLNDKIVINWACMGHNF